MLKYSELDLEIKNSLIEIFNPNSVYSGFSQNDKNRILEYSFFLNHISDYETFIIFKYLNTYLTHYYYEDMSVENLFLLVKSYEEFINSYQSFKRNIIIDKLIL
jgi:hypothetical protein